MHCGLLNTIVCMCMGVPGVYLYTHVLAVHTHAHTHTVYIHSSRTHLISTHCFTLQVATIAVGATARLSQADASNVTLDTVWITSHPPVYQVSKHLVALVQLGEHYKS